MGNFDCAALSHCMLLFPSKGIPALIDKFLIVPRVLFFSDRCSRGENSCSGSNDSLSSVSNLSIVPLL